MNLIALLLTALVIFQIPVPPPSPPPPTPEYPAWLSPGAYAKYDVRAMVARLVGGELALPPSEGELGCEGTFEWSIVKVEGERVYVKLRFDLRLGTSRLSNETVVTIDIRTMYARLNDEPLGYALLWLNPWVKDGDILGALTINGTDYTGNATKLLARIKPIYTPYANYSAADIRCVVVELPNATRPVCLDFDASTGILIRASTLGDIATKLVGVEEFVGDPLFESTFYRLRETNITSAPPGFGIPLRAAILAALLATGILIVYRARRGKSHRV